MMFSTELQYQDLKSKSANFMWVQNVKPFGKHFTSLFCINFKLGKCHCVLPQIENVKVFKVIFLTV